MSDGGKYGKEVADSLQDISGYASSSEEIDVVNTSTNSHKTPSPLKDKIITTYTNKSTSRTLTRRKLKGPFYCDKCPATFSRKESHSMHQKYHGAMLRFACHLCDYSVGTAYSLSTHMLLHKKIMGKDYLEPPSQTEDLSITANGNGEGESESEIPAKRTRKSRASMNDLPHHLAPPKIIDYKSKKCPKCPVYARNLREHILCHGSGKKLKCPFCDYAVDRKSQLAIHINNHDYPYPPIHIDENKAQNAPVIKSEPQSPSKSDGKKRRAYRFRCKLCPAIFQKLNRYKVHKEGHSGKQKGAYACSYCNFSTNRHDIFEKHHNLHMKAKNNDGVIDEDSSGNDENSKSAQNTTILKPNTSNSTPIKNSNGLKNEGGDEEHTYTCPKCPKTFRNKKGANGHVIFHGSGLPYACSYCDYASSALKSRLNHERLHKNPKENYLNKLTSKIRTKYVTKKRRGIRKKIVNPTPAPNGVSKIDEFFNPKSQRRDSLFTPEEFAKYKAGNPDIVYEPLFKTSMGQRKKLKAYKCWDCPYRGADVKPFLNHLELHKGPKRTYVCKLCSYSTETPKSIFHHERLHKVKKEENLISGHNMAAKIKIVRRDRKIVRDINPASKHEEVGPKNFNFVQKLKVSDFMGVECRSEERLDFLTFAADSKSSLILSILLGLGYDIIDDDEGFSSICGIALDSESKNKERHVVSH